MTAFSSKPPELPRRKKKWCTGQEKNYLCFVSFARILKIEYECEYEYEFSFPSLARLAVCYLAYVLLGSLGESCGVSMFCWMPLFHRMVLMQERFC